jgi:hypothetical protein
MENHEAARPAGRRALHFESLLTEYLRLILHPSDIHYTTLVVQIIREALEKMSTAGDSKSGWSSVYNEKEETLSQLHCTREAPSAAPQMCEEALSPLHSTQHIRRF